MFDITDKSSVYSDENKKVRADVIILGCTLPGIVTAHKLKKRFGDTMDIVVLDLASTKSASKGNVSKCNVSFQKKVETNESNGSFIDDLEYQKTVRQFVDNDAKYYIAKYTTELNLPLAEAIMNPDKVDQKLNKLFQHINGSTVACTTNYHDFHYLNLLEKFELNQYQSALDINMKYLFQRKSMDRIKDRSILMSFDRTTMEQHICGALLFEKSRDIMRLIVRLACGACPKTVSVLFYLHQCYRTNGSRNQLDGDNTRFREKLMGYCRKRLAARLLQSIADITHQAKPIERIKSCPNELVVLETNKGGTTYVCNLLAMALKPADLHQIKLDGQLLSQEEINLVRNMSPGRARKFYIQYKENFWARQGYSGDILSVRGPIIWAMERPEMSDTGSTDRYSSLIGYLMVEEEDDSVTTSRKGVLEQLVKLFGEEAANPVTYRESSIADIFVPKCGDYVALRGLTRGWKTPRHVEWGALDIFADGDVGAALEAGHTAYLHLLTCLRPQAQTFEDLSSHQWPITLAGDNIFHRWFARINLISSIRWSIFLSASMVTVGLVRSYFSR